MPGYNQYIGMRYVPIVDGEWSQTKAYEPLVVVVYNGNSYISKTYVPAGTLPTNETYWILAANYNAQVEQYRQEVRQYQQTVDNFDGDITDLEENVAYINSDLTNLTGRVSDNETNINTLLTDMNDWDTVDEYSVNVSQGRLYVRRVGHVVSIVLEGALTNYATGYVTIATLPEKYRPQRNHTGPAIDVYALQAGAIAQYRVLSTGVVSLYAYASGNKQIDFTCTYVI